MTAARRGSEIVTRLPAAKCFRSRDFRPLPLTDGPLSPILTRERAAHALRCPTGLRTHGLWNSEYPWNRPYLADVTDGKCIVQQANWSQSLGIRRLLGLGVPISKICAVRVWDFWRFAQVCRH
jgi:hypothetical protein